MNLSTYLSEYVNRILIQYSETHDFTSRKYLSKDLTYNWKEIANLLGDITGDFDILEQPDAWFLEKCQLVWEVIHEAGVADSSASEVERETLLQLCGWVDCDTVDIRDYASNCGNREDGPLLAVLIWTAALERALGNVYIAKKCPVPFLLRDLLKAPELAAVFGKVPIVFTQLLVGCPRGFNLRNVSWHGFVSAGELHPHLASGLVLLIASLGKILSDDQVVLKRPQFSSFENFHKELGDVFPEIFHRCNEVEDMISVSSNVAERGKILWRKAFGLLQLKRCGYGMVLLVPQLEHCLRLLYCRKNDCPVRLLTAESTAFYTTLDEILAPTKSAVVSPGLLMMLLDVTSCLSGPRLRDRLSHGEIDLNSVPEWLANFVLCLALAAAHSDCQDDTSGPQCGIPLCSVLRQVAGGYQSKFHVVAILRRQLASLLARWSGWHQCSPPDNVVITHVRCQAIQSLDQLLFADERDDTHKLYRLNELLNERQLPTLYRPKPELELAAALGAVASCIEKTAEQMCDAAASRQQLWSGRQLRSRGRATALRMWSVLPDIWSALLCTVMAVALCYRQIPHLASQGDRTFKFVKMLKKSVENAVTLCNSEKNRWTEAHQIFSVLATECLKFFDCQAELVNKM